MHTSYMLCQFYNANRGDRPVREWWTFHPYAEKPKPVARPATPEDIEKLFGRQP